MARGPRGGDRNLVKIKIEQEKNLLEDVEELSNAMSGLGIKK